MSHAALRILRPGASRRHRVAHWVGRNIARLHHGYVVEPTWLELNRVSVAIRGLDRSLDGFRVIHLSDFHLSRKISDRYIQSGIERANRHDPDIVALTGDFVHKGFRHIARIADLLSGLKARSGVFAVLGNHDYSVRNALGIRRYPRMHRAIQQALTDRGIRVLCNEAVWIGPVPGRLALAGVADLWSRCCDPDGALGGLSPDAPRVILAHNPYTLEHLGDHRCDLMLSGHTHGGQITTVKNRRPVLSKRMQRFAAGLYCYGGRTVYVNKGIGFNLRFRYRTRPEVALLTLTPGD